MAEPELRFGQREEASGRRSRHPRHSPGAAFGLRSGRPWRGPAPSRSSTRSSPAWPPDRRHTAANRRAVTRCLTSVRSETECCGFIARSSGRVMIQLARLPLREGCVMSSLRGRRDPRTGRVCGFHSGKQRQNFLIGRARYCNGPNREMPRCTALNRLANLARPPGCGAGPPVSATAEGCCQTGRLTAAHLSGDIDRIERARMRAERNRLRALWRRDPREPGRTIVLVVVR